MSLGNLLPPWHQFLDQKIRGAHFSLGIVAGERFAIELTPSTFPQRHFAGDRFPQRHVAGERVGMLLGKASNVVVRPKIVKASMEQAALLIIFSTAYLLVYEIVVPIGITSNVSMFPRSPYDAQEFLQDCKKMFGVTPRPHWATTYYGGHDIRFVLRRFCSNINGLRDPYCSGGVLEDISNDILAVKNNQRFTLLGYTKFMVNRSRMCTKYAIRSNCEIDIYLDHNNSDLAHCITDVGDDFKDDQESVNDVNNDDDTSDDDGEILQYVFTSDEDETASLEHLSEGEDELVDVRKKKALPSTPIEDPFLTELCDSYDREKYVEKEVNSDEDINLEDDDVLGDHLPIHDPKTKWKYMHPVIGERYEEKKDPPCKEVRPKGKPKKNACKEGCSSSASASASANANANAEEMEIRNRSPSNVSSTEGTRGIGTSFHNGIGVQMDRETRISMLGTINGVPFPAWPHGVNPSELRSQLHEQQPHPDLVKQYVVEQNVAVQDVRMLNKNSGLDSENLALLQEDAAQKNNKLHIKRRKIHDRII
ncbi:lysosomal Pro-X carboxypeptidase [Tanacetum coccineum]